MIVDILLQIMQSDATVAFFQMLTALAIGLVAKRLGYAFKPNGKLNTIVRYVISIAIDELKKHQEPVVQPPDNETDDAIVKIPVRKGESIKDAIDKAKDSIRMPPWLGKK